MYFEMFEKSRTCKCNGLQTLTVESSLADGKGFSLGHRGSLLVSGDQHEAISAYGLSSEVLLTELPIIESL